MGYARHVFLRPLCDYPGCGRSLEAASGGQAADWYYDADTMVGVIRGPGGRRIILRGPDGEQIGEARADSHVDRNLVLDGDDGESRFFCPKHLIERDGRHFGFDPQYERTSPRSAELAEYYYDWAQPLPKPECEAGILEALRTAPVEKDE